MVLKFLSLMFLSIVFFGCGGAKVSATTKPIDTKIEPNSHQVSFIESSSSSEVMLRVVGIGNSMQEARKDATYAAIWFVLFGGDSPILQTKQEKDKFSFVQNDIYNMSSQYITYDSGIKSKKKISKHYNLAYIFRINIQLLKENLIQKQVIQPTQELLGTRLPNIAIITADKKENDMIFVKNTLTSYLIDRDFEVEKISNEVGKIFLKIAKNITVDPMAAEIYAGALSSGSDIYIKATLTKGSRKVGVDFVKKASVTLHAYYTATNKEIGSASGFSPERVVTSYSSIVSEATNDAANKILSQIQKYWKKETKKGKIFKVIVTTLPSMTKSIKQPLYNALKQSCYHVIPNKIIYNIFDYTLECKNIENFQELEMSIAQNYNGDGEIYSDTAKGALLILKIANNENDEIEIQ